MTDAEIPETPETPDTPDATEDSPDTPEAPETETPGPTRGARLQTWAAAAPARSWAWLRPRLVRITTSLVAGALMCASFPPLNWWWAALLALALLTWVLTGHLAIRGEPVTTTAGGFGYGLLFGLAFYIPLLPWVGGLVGPVPWLALALMCALFTGLFGLLAVMVRGLWAWPVWIALIWVTVEWLKTTIPFGGFPWGVAAFGQTTGPLLPLAQLGGAPLVSLATALTGVCLAAVVFGIVDWWHHGHHDLPPAVLLPGVCVAVALLASALVYPQIRRAGVGSGDEPSVTVAIIQGNVPRLGLDFNAQRRAVLDNHVAQTKKLAEEVRAGHQPQPQFVLWPENSSDIDPLRNTDAGAQITAAAQAINAPILVGTVLARPEATRDNPAASNTVIVWDPETGPGARHDKQIVQPFGEYLPWRSFFAKLSPYAARAGYFVPGDGTGVVTAAGVPVGISTCWEVIFDRQPRQAVRNGAQLLAVPTNNATFDAAMSEQQLAIARLRAVEHDRYVLVAGTTGISAVIAPDGREMARTEFFTPGFLDSAVRLKTTETPATKWGPAIGWTLVGAGVAGLLAAIMQNGVFISRIRRRPGRDRTEESHDQ